MFKTQDLILIGIIAIGFWITDQNVFRATPKATIEPGVIDYVDIESEGMVAFDVAENNEVDPSPEPKPNPSTCTCNGTKRVRTPDGQSYMPCPCGKECDCQKKDSFKIEIPDYVPNEVPQKFERLNKEHKEEFIPEDDVLPAPTYKNNRAGLDNYSEIALAQCQGGSCGTRYYQYPSRTYGNSCYQGNCNNYSGHYMQPNVYYPQQPTYIQRRIIQEVPIESKREIFKEVAPLPPEESPKLVEKNREPEVSLKGERMFYFTAEWCLPCKKFEKTEIPILKNKGWGVIDNEESYIRKIDIDKYSNFVKKFQIDRIPCFVIVKDGEELDRIEGKTVTAGELTRFWYKNLPDSK